MLFLIPMAIRTIRMITFETPNDMGENMSRARGVVTMLLKHLILPKQNLWPKEAICFVLYPFLFICDCLVKK
jgi:hypothetical protein